MVVHLAQKIAVGLGDEVESVFEKTSKYKKGEEKDKQKKSEKEIKKKQNGTGFLTCSKAGADGLATKYVYSCRAKQRNDA